jgi:hypothetical protein
MPPLPYGYRIRHKLFIMPVLVAGRYRWCEHVAIIQRYMYPSAAWIEDSRWWHTIGYYDELAETLAKQPAGELIDDLC